MKRRTLDILTLLMLCFSLVITSSCSKAGGGAVMGAGLGGTAGALLYKKNPLLGAAAGAAAGMILGYGAGNSWDLSDLKKTQAVAEYGKSGVPMAWTNPNTNKSYRAIPEPAQLNSDGLISRNIDLVSPGGTITKATWLRDEVTSEWYLSER